MNGLVNLVDFGCLVTDPIEMYIGQTRVAFENSKSGY